MMDNNTLIISREMKRNRKEREKKEEKDEWGEREREEKSAFCINRVGKNWEVGVDERREGGQKKR